MEILATLTLILGFIAIFYGVLGVFGYSLIKPITRKQAIYFLFSGFLSLVISGNLNLRTTGQDPQSELPLSPFMSTSSTTTTLVSTNSTLANNKTPIPNIATLDILNMLGSLIVIDNFSSVPSYDRELYFKSWRDEDGDCQNTRAEVLILESIGVTASRFLSLTIGFLVNNLLTPSCGVFPV